MALNLRIDRLRLGGLGPPSSAAVTGPEGPGAEYYDDVIAQTTFTSGGASSTGPNFLPGTATAASVTISTLGSPTFNGTTDRIELNGTSQAINFVANQGDTAVDNDRFNFTGDVAFEIWNFYVPDFAPDTVVYPITFYDATDPTRVWQWRVHNSGRTGWQIFTDPASAGSQLNALSDNSFLSVDTHYDYLGFFRNGSNVFFFKQENGGSFTSGSALVNTMAASNPGAIGDNKHLRIGGQNQDAGTPVWAAVELEVFRLTQSNRDVTGTGSLTAVPDKDIATSS